MKKSVKIILACLSLVFVVGIAVIIGACLQNGNAAADAGTAVASASTATLTKSQTDVIAIGIVGVVMAALSAVAILFSKNAGVYGLLKYVIISVLCVVMSNSIGTAVNTYYDFADSFLYDQYRSANAIGGVNCSDDNFTYDFAYPTEKVFKTDDLGTDSDYLVQLAKNEYEGFQLTVASIDGGKIKVTMTDYKNAANEVLPVTLFKEHYIAVVCEEENCGSVFDNEYPDALIPYDGEEVEIDGQNSQTFYIQTASKKDTTAGNYTATLKITSDDSVILEKTLTAEVWDFALPDSPATATAVGLNGLIFPSAGLASNNYGTNTWLTFYDGSITLTAEQEALYKSYYDLLLEHGLCANFLPYDLLDSRADAYMSNPKVTAFCIPYPKTDDAKLTAYWEKVNSNPSWAAKAYFYPVDEPFESARVANYNAIIERLGRLCPGYNMVTPFSELSTTDDETGELLPEFEMQKDNNTIICPISKIYDEEETFSSEIADLKDGGAKSWWYVCCSPNDRDGYCNMFTYQKGIKHRLLFWQQVQYGVEGYLYYDVAAYGFCVNPWLQSQTHTARNTCGDGCLVYPGAYIGEYGPISSLRLESVANGIEDTTYMKVAEELFGNAWVQEKIAKVTNGLTDYTDDDALLQQVRREIAIAIVEAE